MRNGIRTRNTNSVPSSFWQIWQWNPFKSILPYLEFFLTRPRFQKLRQTVDIYFHRVFSKSTECSESLLFTFSLKFLFKASRAPLPSRPLTLAFRARLKISGRRLLRILFSFLLYRSFVSATACVCVCVCVQRKNLERKGGKLQGEAKRLQLFCRLNRVRSKAATQIFWHIQFLKNSCQEIFVVRAKKPLVGESMISLEPNGHDCGRDY